MALHMFGALFLHAHDAQELRDDPAGRAADRGGDGEPARVGLPHPLQAGADAAGGRAQPGADALRLLLSRRLRRVLGAGVQRLQRRTSTATPTSRPSISGGWYDPFAVATTTYFAAMAAKNTTPQRLIMGPWTHASMRGVGETFAGDVDFGPDARWGDARYNEERLRWFDRWLTGRGPRTAVRATSPRRSRDLRHGRRQRAPDTRQGKLDHGGRWREEQEWPLARTRFADFYLRADGGLSEAAPDGDDPPARFTFDPSHPVPTIAGTVTGFFELVPLSEGMNPAFVPPRARMRSIVLPGAAHQQETPAVIGGATALPAAGAPAGRAGLPDAAAARAGRGDRADRRDALDLVVGGRHRLHRQAARRLPAEPGLPGRLRHEPGRLDHPRPLPRRLGARGF